MFGPGHHFSCLDSGWSYYLCVLVYSASISSLLEFVRCTNCVIIIIHIPVKMSNTLCQVFLPAGTLRQGTTLDCFRHSVLVHGGLKD